MKMAKKVLSVVLAVVMALSCFAVAGSAFGPGASATANASVKLLAAVGTGSFDTENFLFNYPDPEGDKAASVTAKVGDTVYIYVYGTTDYYVFNFTADVFYPAAFKTPVDFYEECLINDWKMTLEESPMLPEDNQALFFGNSDLVTNYGFGDNLYWFTNWSQLVASGASKEVAKAWPTDAEGKIIDGFHAEGDNTKPSADWKIGRFAEIITSAAKSKPVKMNGQGYTFRLPLYIPEGTPDGIYTVTIPELAAGRKDKPTGYTRLGMANVTEKPRINANTTTPVWEVDTEGKTQNFDFSQATVTITVQSDTPTPPTPLTWDALQSAYDDAILLDEEDYTTSSWDTSGIETALANAAAELNETTGHKCTDQKDIDALAAAITDAEDKLDKKADYTALNDAIAAGDDVVSKQDAYDTTLATWTTFTSKLAAAKAVDTDLADKEENNTTIANAAKAVTDAIEALTLLKADYTEYDKAVAAANTAFTKTTWYSEDSLETLSGVMDTYGSLSKDLLKKDQSTVNEATDAINDAVGALVEVKAEEYEALSDLIGTYKWRMTNGTLKGTDYTEASWGDFTTALTSAETFVAQTNYTQKYEDENGDVAAMIDLLTGAYEDLVEAGPADYIALNKVIDEFYELNEDAYTEDSWGGVENYIDNEIDYELNENFQDTIDETYIPALNALIKDLVLAEFTITYNYYVGDVAMDPELATMVENTNKTTYTYEDEVVIDLGSISLEGYTCESASNTGWDAGDKTGNQTVNVVFSKVEAAQHNITYKYVDEVGATVAATTTKPATFKEDQSVTFTAADFTAESSNYEFKSVNPTTIAEGTTTDVTVTVTFKLKDADYSALDDAIKAAEAKKQYQYTEESWTPFAEALAAAKNVEAGLKITDQKTIDDAKNLLNAKMEALVIAVNGSVFDVQFEATGVNKVQATVKVMGRAMMVQFQELSNGGTRSYDRYNENVVSIVSYDKDGNVVESTSKDLAYEIWTIDTRFDGPEMGVRVKNNGSSTWEKLDESYKFTYEKDIAVISADLDSESGAQGAVMATVVTGSEVVYLQFKMDDGSTVTLAPKSTDQDGNKVFQGNAFMNHEGENVITIRVYDGAKWTVSETTLTYTADAK